MKPRGLPNRYIVFLYVFILLLCSNPWAMAKPQLHFRTGLLYGQFHGAFDGEFMVPNSLDWEYEMPLANTISGIFRFTLAMDLPKARPFYTYTGTGARFYLSSKARYSDQVDEGINISTSPTMQYYISAELGVAQVLVKSFGEVIQSVSNTLELGTNVGAHYFLSKRFSLEAQVGGTYGYGFSSVAVNGTTLRVLLGGAYAF